MKKEILQLLMEGRVTEAQSLLFEELGNMEQAKQMIEEGMQVATEYLSKDELQLGNVMLSLMMAGKKVETIRMLQDIDNGMSIEEKINFMHELEQQLLEEGEAIDEQNMQLEKLVIPLLLENNQEAALQLVRQNTDWELTKAQLFIEKLS